MDPKMNDALASARSGPALDGSRRRWSLGLAGGLALGGLAGCAGPSLGGAGGARATAASRARVVVVGGGYGGATAAKYLKYWGGDAVEVLLIERQARYVSCPLSNLVIGGSRRLEDLTVGYEGLRSRGVQVLTDEVLEIDPAGRRVSLRQGGVQGWDRLVVSPGIGFIPKAIAGLDEAAPGTILHAWQAGEQTLALRRQLESMPDGGVYVISIPKTPYRCPPGPYERICQVAHYFKSAKPRSRIIVLDANPDIVSKKGLFLAAWNGAYRGLIDYRPNHEVVEVDARNRVAITDLGERIRGDVMNIIAPQRAGELAIRAGLANAGKRWCGVDWMTTESLVAPGVHVIGDATLSAPGMPKSGHMANQHGKTAAAAILALLDGRTPPAPVMANTCYSFLDDRNVAHVASVHQWNADKKTLEPVAGAGGLSTAPSELEAQYAFGWARNIWNDMLT